MTRIYLHIGLEHVGVARLQQVMADKRAQMLAKGVLFPQSAGARNHTRLFMAVTDPDHVDALRAGRGYSDPARQAALRAEVATTLARDIATHQPSAVILSASQLGPSLARRSELERLRDLLAPLSRDIRIIAHVDAPARILARHYAAQVFAGRSASLDLEAGLAGADWWDAALAQAPVIDARRGAILRRIARRSGWITPLWCRIGRRFLAQMLCGCGPMMRRFFMVRPRPRRSVRPLTLTRP